MIIISTYYILFFILFLIKKYYRNLYKKTHRIVIPYEYLKIKSYIDEDLKKVMDFLIEHYKDSDLSVEKLGTGCRVPKLRIPVIIKKQFQLTFPQYLNSIRLVEARKLLKQTNQSIIDIAMNIGYKSVVHFNRIFKKYERTSPLQFRKKI